MDHYFCNTTFKPYHQENKTPRWLQKQGGCCYNPQCYKEYSPATQHRKNIIQDFGALGVQERSKQSENKESRERDPGRTGTLWPKWMSLSFRGTLSPFWSSLLFLLYFYFFYFILFYFSFSFFFSFDLASNLFIHLISLYIYILKTINKLFLFLF